MQFFQEALEGDLNELGDIQRRFDVLSGDARQLVICVEVRIFRSLRVAKFTFVLNPVSVERIDVLESKLRDLQEELERLQRRFGDGHIQLEASTKDASTRKLLWSASDSDSFIVDQQTGVVSIHRPGVYSITAVVSCTSNTRVNVLKNQECIYTGSQSQYTSPVTASTIARFDANDSLAIVFQYISGASYLYIMQIGC